MNPQNIKRIIISFGTALLLLVGLFLAVSILSTRPALAQGSIIYVDVDAPGPTHDGLSWTTAFTNVQDALSAATSGDEIWVAEGVYYPDEGAGRVDNVLTSTFALTSGVMLYGGFAATETLRTERDWDTHVTVLSGDLDENDTTDANGIVTSTSHISGSNAYHVVSSNSSITETAGLDGFTITGGNANTSDFDARGGGMNNDHSSPTVANLVLSGNWADRYGGGIANTYSDAHLSNITFSSNQAGWYGGGLYNYVCTPTLQSVVFIGNRVDPTDGSGGGGMANLRGSPIMTDVVFIGNQAAGNKWSLAGGGMYNATFSQPKLTNVIFSGNQAVTGGGIYNNDSSPKLTNVVFSGNQANSSGGGMYNKGSSTSTLINATFSRNQASGYGGGINNTAIISLTNCILWGNEDYAGNSQDAQIYNSGGIIDVAYSLVQGIAVYPGTGNINSDPLFIDDNGSDSIVGTGDDNLRLRGTSPAIDAGDNSALSGVNLDLDNQPRFVDIPTVADTGNGTAPIVDMGAYEHPLTEYPLPPVANAGVDQQVTTDSTVTLDGSASSDPNNQPLDYSWVQTGGSPLISFSNTLSKTTFVAPDTATVLTFSLTVANSNSLTDTDTVVIIVTESLSPIYLPLILRQE